MLPILLIVLVTFFGTQSEPVYSLAREGKYVHELHTGRLGVSFWVKDKAEFNKAYPVASYKRLEVERHVSAGWVGGCGLVGGCRGVRWRGGGVVVGGWGGGGVVVVGGVGWWWVRRA